MLVKCCGCGKEFNKVPSSIRKHNFCSRECMNNNPEWKKSKSEIASNLHLFSNHYKKLNKIIVDGDTSYIYTSKNEKITVDTDDLEKVKNHTWRMNTNGYAETEHNRKTIRIHRLLMDAPKNLVVDHINHDKKDNRRSNLRLCTYAENNHNVAIGKSKKSNIRGVSWSKREQRWRAKIVVNKKEIGLGYYKNINDAIKARKEAEKKYYGEFAYK